MITDSSEPAASKIACRRVWAARPVLMIATYGEGDVVDVMNMAWGGICVENEEISKKEEAVAFPSANRRLGRNSRFLYSAIVQQAPQGRASNAQAAGGGGLVAPLLLQNPADNLLVQLLQGHPQVKWDILSLDVFSRGGHILLPGQNPGHILLCNASARAGQSQLPHHPLELGIVVGPVISLQAFQCPILQAIGLLLDAGIQVV